MCNYREVNIMGRQIIPKEGFVVLEDGAEDYKLANGMVMTTATQRNHALVPCIVSTMGYDKPIVFKTAYGDEKYLNQGAKVLIMKGSGTPLSSDGKEYLVIEVNRLIAIVND